MKKRSLSFVRTFFEMESASGILLLIAAVAALILANSPRAVEFERIFQAVHALTVGGKTFALSLQLVVNDGLMTLFFLLIGLQLKQEWAAGRLSLNKKMILPVGAALGGMLIPALIYWMVSADHSAVWRGWAIPTATDIAFSLGVLSLFGRRVPRGLIFFLMMLAILDDAGAVLIIGLFYTSHGSALFLLRAAAMTGVLCLMGQLRVRFLPAWWVGGLLLWYCLLRAGVHPVLAGVLLAMAMPAEGIERLIGRLHTWVAFLIMPLFALMNAGVSLQGPVMMTGHVGIVSAAVMAGLILGKPLGIMGMSVWLVGRRLAELPEGVNWGMFLGAAFLCGIGFTMSLFIGTLAFQNEYAYTVAVRRGVLLGSLFAGMVGTLILHVACQANSRRKP